MKNNKKKQLLIIIIILVIVLVALGICFFKNNQSKNKKVLDDNGIVIPVSYYGFDVCEKKTNNSCTKNIKLNNKNHELTFKVVKYDETKKAPDVEMDLYFDNKKINNITFCATNGKSLCGLTNEETILTTSNYLIMHIKNYKNTLFMILDKNGNVIEKNIDAIEKYPGMYIISDKQIQQLSKNLSTKLLDDNMPVFSENDDKSINVTATRFNLLESSVEIGDRSYDLCDVNPDEYLFANFKIKYENKKLEYIFVDGIKAKEFQSNCDNN